MTFGESNLVRKIHRPTSSTHTVHTTLNSLVPLASPNMSYWNTFHKSITQIKKLLTTLTGAHHATKLLHSTGRAKRHDNVKSILPNVASSTYKKPGCRKDSRPYCLTAPLGSRDVIVHVTIW